MRYGWQLIGLFPALCPHPGRYLRSVFCIFGSAITVIDGYARALSESHLLITRKPLDQRRYHQGWAALPVQLFGGIHLVEMANVIGSV